MTAYFSPSALAERWECSTGYVLRLIKSGALPAISIGKMWRVRPEDAELFETSGGTETPTKEPCDVYVIRCKGFVKIGKAEDTGRRIAALQAANPFDIEVIAVLSNCDGHVLERELHRRFSDHNHRGEWFRDEGKLAIWIQAGCPA